MPILNYTTKIDPSKTASEVEVILAKAGASGVAKRFENGKPVAIAFTADTPLGPREFTLPVDAERVQMVLRKQQVPPSMQTLEQARRVAWRVVKSWVEAQLAIIQTEMVTIDQVMLPYMRADSGATVFEEYQQGQQLLLEAGKS